MVGNVAKYPPPGAWITKKLLCLDSIYVNKDLQTWHRIGWQKAFADYGSLFSWVRFCCQPGWWAHLPCESASSLFMWRQKPDLTDDKSTLVQVMVWCRQATSNYLSQCWPSFLSPYGVTRVVSRARDGENPPKLTTCPPKFVKSGGRSSYIWQVIYRSCIECPLFSGQSPLFLRYWGGFPP